MPKPNPIRVAADALADQTGRGVAVALRCDDAFGRPNFAKAHALIDAAEREWLAVQGASETQWWLERALADVPGVRLRIAQRIEAEGGGATVRQFITRFPFGIAHFNGVGIASERQIAKALSGIGIRWPTHTVKP